MPRGSEVSIEGRRLPDGAEVPAAIFPSGRVVIERGEAVAVYASEQVAPHEPMQLGAAAAAIRTGVLFRREDESGVSGTGVVADFAHLPSGRVVQEWRNERNASLETRDPGDSGLDIRPSMALAIQIHGHKGRSVYRYDDGHEVVSRADAPDADRVDGQEGDDG